MFQKMKNRAIHNDDVCNTRKEQNALPLGSTFFNQSSVRTNESMIKKDIWKFFKLKFINLSIFTLCHTIAIFFIQLIMIKHLIQKKSIDTKNFFSRNYNTY